MAKQTGFPLEMAGGVKVNTLEELRENFDLEKTVSYYMDGTLLTWLRDRHYEPEAIHIINLNHTGAHFYSHLCNALGVVHGKAQEIKRLGDITSDFGHADEAIALYGEAEKLFREERDSLGLADTLYRLGALHNRLGHVDEADKLSVEAVGLYRRERFNQGLANALLLQGNLRLRQERVDEAEKLYSEAADLYCEERDNLGLANTLKALGDIKRKQECVEECRKQYLAALELYTLENDPVGLAYTYCDLAVLTVALGDQINGKRYAVMAKILAGKCGLPSVVKYVHAALQPKKP